MHRSLNVSGHFMHHPKSKEAHFMHQNLAYQGVQNCQTSLLCLSTVLTGLITWSLRPHIGTHVAHHGEKEKDDVTL